MKILKPGKAEMRKFVCPNCGCVFVATQADRNRQDRDFVSHCPQCDYAGIQWCDGEPYEEPTSTQDTQDDAVKLYELMKEAWPYSIGALSALVDFLIANGVTFKEEP